VEDTNKPGFNEADEKFFTTIVPRLMTTIAEILEWKNDHKTGELSRESTDKLLRLLLNSMIVNLDLVSSLYFSFWDWKTKNNK